MLPTLPWARLLIVTCLLLPVVSWIGCGGGTDGTDSAGTVAIPTDSMQAESKPAETAEESVEALGDEAEGGKREEILRAFHGYLGGIARRDYATACQWLAKVPLETLLQLSGSEERRGTCPDAFRLLVAPEMIDAARQQNPGRIVKVRVEGTRSIVIFHAPGASSWQMPLLEEDGAWKVSSGTAGVLVP